MSLKPLESVQLNAYFQTGNFSAGERHWITLGSPPPLNGFVYVDRLDAFMSAGFNWTNPTATPGHLQFDPLFLDNTSSIAKFVPNSPNASSFIGVGEWDRVNATQLIYGGINDGNVEIWPIDPNTLIMNDVGSSIFPFDWERSDASLALVGGWDAGPSGASISDMLWLETWGYAIAFKRVRHTDGNLYRGLCQIDLTTGLATLIDVPLAYTSTPAALFEAFEFRGDTFDLDGLQFVPDDDSLPATPKGRLFFHSSVFLSDSGNVPNADWRQYMKIIDWNPEGLPASPGNSNREHLRETLFTKLNFIQRQAFGTNPNSLGDKIDNPPGTANGLARTRFHPKTRTFVTLDDYGDIPSPPDEERGFVRNALTPILAETQTPVGLNDVQTAKTVNWRSRALGDIGDAVGGAVATWSASRISTLDEPLDTVGLPATSTVDNPPIDTGTLVVKDQNQAVLNDPADYTVVESTGVITWQGSQPLVEAGYTASYRHVNTPAVPAHGTLLQSTSRSDAQGISTTRVSYPDDDDLVAQRDRIDVSITDD